MKKLDVLYSVRLLLLRIYTQQVTYCTVTSFSTEAVLENPLKKIDERGSS